MTDNTQEARSLILAALMVFSVFAGTVALTGTAAAGTSNTTEIDGNVSPNNVSTNSQHPYSVSVNLSDVNTSDSTSDAYAQFHFAPEFDLSSASVSGQMVDGNKSGSSAGTSVSQNINTTTNTVNITWSDGANVQGLENVTVSFDISQVNALGTANFYSLNTSTDVDADSSLDVNEQQFATIEVGDTATGSSTASVTFNNQTTTGDSVNIANASLSDGGFVVLHNATELSTGDATGSVIDVSDYLSPGSHSDVTVNFSSSISESQSIVAMTHFDSDGEETYDFVTSGGSDDGPYTSDRSAVTDSAFVNANAISNGAIVYQGQTVVATNFDSGGEVVLRSGTPGGDSTFENSYVADSDATVDYSSADLQTGQDYYLEGTGGHVVTFEVVSQNLDLTVDDTELNNAGSGTMSTFSVDSN